jgi:arylsulfatase A-like enzyme
MEPVASNPTQQLYFNSYYPARSPDFLIQFDDYFMKSISLFTSHGTVYPYDRRVPMLIMTPGVESSTVEQPVATVDLAPTLAALAGIPFPDDLDGTDLTPLMNRD